MSVSLNMNEVNQVPRGSVIYEKNEPLKSVCLIVKGRVLVESDGIKTVFSSGNFLGVFDIDLGAHSFTYTAYDNVVLYTFSVTCREDFHKILEKKSEYRGLLNTSTNYFIREMHITMGELEEKCKQLREIVFAQYDFYRKLGDENGVSVDKISSVDILKKKKVGGISLCKELDYYLACTSMPVTAQKNYFMGSSYISDFHYEQQKNCIFSLLVGCQTYAEQLKRCFGILVSDEKNLFTLYTRMAMDLAHVGGDNKKAMLAIDELIEKINETETYLTEKAGISISLDRERMEGMYYALISGETYEKKVEVTEKKVVHDLDNSLEQILEYAEISEEHKTQFETSVKAFGRLSDKESKVAEADKIRKEICASFYEIYEAVFLKSLHDEKPPLCVNMFLKFGFVSENLLSPEAIDTLLHLEDRNELEGGCQVYLLPDWLKSIYRLEKEPSKNEFDMDFNEFLRHEKATGFLDDEQYNASINDPVERVHFEISNLFRYANRTVHGRISTFVPILYEDSMAVQIEKAFLTADKLNSMLNKIQRIDYSVFFRERMVSYDKVKITKETIMKKCLPDIILFPVYGQNGIMWQDIVGKRRDSAGRFLFPILLEKDLQKEMLKVLGYFRWEICRSEQGMQWNNLHYPSLTSEYTDYLQFYRKNSELSPEAKAKVKTQLTQVGNRHREVFMKDYIDWILRESKGAMKVNRVARNILYTYVPFSAKQREKLMEQSVYQEAGKRFRISHSRRKKEIEASCGRFERAGLPVPNELLLTKKFYEL